MHKNHYPIVRFECYMSRNSKLQEGIDERQFEELFQKEYDRLYYYAIGIIPDSDVVSDLLQDLFAAVWTNRQMLEVSQMHPYLTKAIRNRCLTWLRHSSVEGERVEAESMAEMLLDDDDGEILKERLNKLDKALSQMPEKTRFVIEECYYHNKQYKEVAEELDITSDGIKKHITKAFRFLREYFEVKN